MSNINLYLAVGLGTQIALGLCLNKFNRQPDSEGLISSLCLTKNQTQLEKMLNGSLDCHSIFTVDSGYSMPKATDLFKELKQIEENLKTNDVVLMFKDSEWFVLSKVQELKTEGFIPFIDYIKLVYASQQYPQEVMEQVFEHSEFPLAVFEVLEYEDGENEFRFQPLFLEHPSHLVFEDNMVLMG